MSQETPSAVHLTWYLPRILRELQSHKSQFSPHRCTGKDSRVGDWAAANNVELAYVPFYASWLNRIEAQFTALRYFALDGTDHPSHAVQASMMRRYIAWRNRHTTDHRLRKIVREAQVIKKAKVA